MTKADLWAYLVAHPNDQEAFHAFDHFTANASPKTCEMPPSQSDIEEVAQPIRQKVEGGC
jgi:hypothetical protein